jgi:hypothetical protein
MPLTDLQFRLGTTADPVEILNAVHAFFAAHSNLAYSVSEIADELGISDDLALMALEELAYLKALEAREVRQGLYFKFAAQLDTSKLS